MLLTVEDIKAIKTAIKPSLVQIDQNISDLTHKSNLHFDQIDQRFARVDQRLEGVIQKFDQIDQKIADLTHKSNLRLTAIELRLDSIDYKLSQIAVFVPFENAFLLPPSKRQQSLD